MNNKLYCYLKIFNYQTMGSTSSIATAVNSKIIKAMPFVLPTEDEINEFHTVTEPMFNQIKLNQIENSRLIELRDTLLPKLMSGEIDVSNVDISTDKLSFSCYRRQKSFIYVQIPFYYRFNLFILFRII